MATGQKPWWEEPLRVLDICNGPEMAEFDYEKLGRWCREFHANVIHFQFNRETKGGFHPDEAYCRTRVATRRNRDVLAGFLPIAKRCGTRVVLYVNGHWFSKSFVDQYPDWRVLREDGSRVENLYGDNDSTFCINSPWRDWMRTRIEDFCQYDIDGLFWDGPLYFLNRKGCYCHWCRERFRRAFGREMPSWDRTKFEDWALLAEFAVSSLTEYYRDAYGWVKSLKPEAAVYMNAANVAEPAWLVGRDNHRLMPYADILLAEGGFGMGRIAYYPPWKTSASSKFYETQAAGKPAINAVTSADSPWRRCQLSGAEMSVLLAQASRGVNPYAAFFVEGMGQSGDKASREVYGFLEKNAVTFAGTRSLARVALLTSTHTLDRYAGVDIPWTDISGVTAQKAEAVGNHSASFYGHYELLVRARVPFDVLDDHALETGRLAQYELLVLPTAACLTDKECEAIRQFVQQGGKVIADFETSHYDEHGRRRKELGLAELFGVSSLNKVTGPRQYDFAKLSAPWDTLAQIGAPFVPATRYHLNVALRGGTTRMVFSVPLASNIPDTVEFTDEPFLVEHAWGKGRSFYFPGTFGEMFQTHRFPAYARIIRGILARETTPLVRVENLSNLVEVNLRGRPGQTLVHLVNCELSGIEEVSPATDVTFHVTAPHAVRRVRALRMEKDLAFRQNAGEVTFLLPRLEAFEIIAIEGES